MFAGWVPGITAVVVLTFTFGVSANIGAADTRASARKRAVFLWEICAASMIVPSTNDHTTTRV
jgi:hypothetical protein